MSVIVGVLWTYICAYLNLKDRAPGKWTDCKEPMPDCGIRADIIT